MTWISKENTHEQQVSEHVHYTSDEDASTNGVAEIEAITQTWTRFQMYISWGAIILITAALALETQSIVVYSNYATASFTQFSLLSTVQVVTGVVSVVIKPILAKLADTMGRLEGFVISMAGLTLGPVLLALSPNIGVYFAGQIFLTIGQIGMNFMTICFAMDSSDFVNRVLVMMIPGECYVVTPWIVAPMTTKFVEGPGWRWGTGIWAIIIPVCSVPLFTVLVVNRMKAKQLGLKRQKLNWKKFVAQMDVIGIGLLTTGLALVFVSIPLASSVDNSQWGKPHIITMLAVGVALLVAFPIYEIHIPQYPMLSARVFKNFAIDRAFFVIFTYYLAFYTYSPYHFGWLRVVMGLGNTAATNIDNIHSATTQFMAIVTGLAIKFIRRLKWAIVCGGCIVMLGFGLIYKFRDETTTSIAQLVIPQLMYGAGSGILTTPNSVFVQSYCTHEEAATTVGLYMSFLSLSQVVGDSVSGAIYRRQYSRALHDAFPEKGADWDQRYI